MFNFVDIRSSGLHGKEDQRREFLTREPTPIIFTIYRKAFRNKYPEYKEKCIGFPILSNLRYLVRNTYLKQDGFIFHRHPGTLGGGKAGG